MYTNRAEEQERNEEVPPACHAFKDVCQTVEECKSELHCCSPLSTFRQRFQLTPLQQYTNRLSHPSFSYIFPFFSWLSLSHFCLASGMLLLASSECVRMVKRIQADRDLLHPPLLPEEPAEAMFNRQLDKRTSQQAGSCCF